jgi:hypothetical protein
MSLSELPNVCHLPLKQITTLFSSLYVALLAALIAAVVFESLFVICSLAGAGPYSALPNVYGYSTLTQPILLFCVRATLTGFLAGPAAWFTLVCFRPSNSGPRRSAGRAGAG